MQSFLLFSMEVEVVSFSPSQLRTVRRLCLNALSNHESLLSCSRAALKSEGVPERFLIERGWAIRGDRLAFVGSEKQARSSLDELLQPLAPSVSSFSSTNTVASAETVARVKSAVLKEEQRGGLWAFGCVFRFSVAEFARICRLPDDAGELTSALRIVAEDSEFVSQMKGKLEVTENGFVYSRTE